MSTYLDSMHPEWMQARKDPVREQLLSRGEQPNLDSIWSMAPPTTGDAAFDGTLIAANRERLQTFPKVDTGHPMLDLSVKTGLASIDATFQGDHPKYGIEGYAENVHDGFPPIIISAVDALSAWGMLERATHLFRYWLLHFVRSDGTIAYRGTSLAELGQLLHTAVMLVQRAGTPGWWQDGFRSLDRIAQYLLALLHESETEKGDGLIAGVPEDDEKEKVGRYFHNNAWVARGLREWASLCDQLGANPATGTDATRNAARTLALDTQQAIRKCWPGDLAEWWLPPQVEPLVRPQSLTDTREASYTNYRYWPELLSSDLLPPELANRVIDARLVAGGQFCGMTRFEDHLDDWPLVDYLYALWRLGRRWDFLLSLYGHVAYHQAAGHLTAYEQVSLPPGRKLAPYCLPCQLVAARAARLLVK